MGSARTTAQCKPTMLYIFKSRAAADLIMLEPNGRRLLEIIGKEPGAKGIITPGEMDAAVKALQAAVLDEQQDPLAAQPQDGGDPASQAERVTLRQRVLPMIEMLRRCEKANREIVWGV
jgi:hypothetical protein